MLYLLTNDELRYALSLDELDCMPFDFCNCVPFDLIDQLYCMIFHSIHLHATSFD